MKLYATVLKVRRVVTILQLMRLYATYATILQLMQLYATYATIMQQS